MENAFTNRPSATSLHGHSCYPYSALSGKDRAPHFRRMRELKPFQDANPVNNTVSVPFSFDA